MSSVGLVILFRELRLDDNTALLKALEANDKVIVCFIFNPKQVTNVNKYFSSWAFDFLTQSVACLNHTMNGKLTILKGKPHKVLNQILHSVKVNTVYFTRDFTPFSRMRADKLISICIKHKTHIEQVEDHILFFPSYGYRKFTPFFTKAKGSKVKSPVSFNIKLLDRIIHYNKGTNPKTIIKTTNLKSKGINYRTEALARLKLNYSK